MKATQGCDISSKKLDMLKSTTAVLYFNAKQRARSVCPKLSLIAGTGTLTKKILLLVRRTAAPL